LARAVRLPIGRENDTPTDASGNSLSAIVPYDRPHVPSSAGGTTIGSPEKLVAFGFCRPARPRRS
jgi:hypothetical protein